MTFLLPLGLILNSWSKIFIPIDFSHLTLIASTLKDIDFREFREFYPYSQKEMFAKFIKKTLQKLMFVK